MKALLSLLFVMGCLATTDEEIRAYHYTIALDWKDRRIIIRNYDYCSIDGPDREQIDWYHNYLRQMVAGGETYRGRTFEQQQMNGLLYDCKLEAQAEDKLKHPEIELPEEYATIEFKFYNRRREGHYSHALELEMGIDVVRDEDKLSIMTNPKATRFGCWEAPRASKPRLLCVYDRKPEETLAKAEGGLCYLDFQCTMNEESVCLWGLCYSMD